MRTCRGSALLVVLLILMVLSILGITLLDITIVHLRIGSADKYYNAAYYYAEAGLQHQIELMANHMESLYRERAVSSNRENFYYRMLNTPISNLSFKEYDGNQVKIKIVNKHERLLNGAMRFTIYSSCTIGNIKRTVKARVDILWEDPEDSDFSLYKTNFQISQWGETYESNI